MREGMWGGEGGLGSSEIDELERLRRRQNPRKYGPPLPAERRRPLYDRQEDGNSEKDGNEENGRKNLFETPRGVVDIQMMGGVGGVGGPEGGGKIMGERKVEKAPPAQPLGEPPQREGEEGATEKKKQGKKKLPRAEEGESYDRKGRKIKRPPKGEAVDEAI